MGIYINPGNKAFMETLRDHYIDKSGLIRLINRTIDTPGKLTCVSRPRRFGKSFAAKMLCAFYDCSCDSREMFRNLEIAEDPSFEQHLNQYHVINLDISGFISDAKTCGKKLEAVPGLIVEALEKEIKELYPQLHAAQSLEKCLFALAEQTGRRFIFIIDEWDGMIREAAKDSRAQERYLNLLRGWFKNSNFTPYIVAGAYMTGILPIKKDGSQSAISDFLEYTLLDPSEFAEYTGFTEQEVKGLCSQYEMDFSAAKMWYDGYTVGREKSIYNPYSVMNAMKLYFFRNDVHSFRR